MRQRDGEHDEHELKKELSATIQARKDLGPEYESALVDSFIEKLGARVDAQVEQRVRRELAEQRPDAYRPAGGKGEGKPGRSFNSLPYVSLVFAIPLSAIGAANAELPGLIVAWLGIVGVNVAHAWSQRGGSPRGRSRESEIGRASCRERV